MTKNRKNNDAITLVNPSLPLRTHTLVQAALTRFGIIRGEPLMLHTSPIDLDHFCECFGLLLVRIVCTVH